MTEYDYSPAAYERYIAQQTRVSNWVDDTLQQAHAYSNPFVLSPTLRDRSFYDTPDNHAHRHHDQWSVSSRPSRSRSRSYADHAHYDRTPPSRHRTQSHSRSSTMPRDPVYPSHGPQHQLYAQPLAARTSGQRIHTSPPRNYLYAPPAHSPTRQAYVNQPPPGQVYHNTPAPVPKDTPYRHASHSRHSSSKPPPQPYLLVQSGGPKAEYKHGPPIHAPIPTKPHGAQQPLLKRLFGFVSNSPVSGRSGNGRGIRGSSY